MHCIIIKLLPLQYKDIVHQLGLLAKWASSPDVMEFLKVYRQQPLASNKHGGDGKKIVQGLVVAVGKRKTSTAVVRLGPGEGEMTINKKTFIKYFPQQEDREQVLYPLMVTNTLGDFNITASVKGGGTTG